MKKIMLLILTVLFSGSSIQSSEHISDYLHAVRPLFFALPPHIPTASSFSLIGLVEYASIAAYSLMAGFAVSKVISTYKNAAQKKEWLINCLLPYVYCDEVEKFRDMDTIISIAVCESTIARLLPEYLAKNNDDVTMQGRLEYIKKYVWAAARTKLLEHLKAEQKDREQLIQSFAEATKYNNNQDIERDWAKFNVIPAHRVHRVYDKDIRGTFKCHDIVVTGNIDNFNVELFLYSSEFLNCNDNGGLNFNFKDEPLKDSDGEHICLSVIKENNLVKKAAIYDNRDYYADRNGKNMKEHNLTPDELLRLNTQKIKRTFYDRHCEIQKEGLLQSMEMTEQPKEMEGDTRWVSPWYFYPFAWLWYGDRVAKKQYSVKSLMTQEWLSLKSSYSNSTADNVKSIQVALSEDWSSFYSYCLDHSRFNRSIRNSSDFVQYVDFIIARFSTDTNSEFKRYSDFDHTFHEYCIALDQYKSTHLRYKHLIDDTNFLNFVAKKLSDAKINSTSEDPYNPFYQKLFSAQLNLIEAASMFGNEVAEYEARLSFSNNTYECSLPMAKITNTDTFLDVLRKCKLEGFKKQMKNELATIKLSDTLVCAKLMPEIVL